MSGGAPDIAIVNATILPMGGAPRIERGSLTIRGNVNALWRCATVVSSARFATEDR